MRNTIIALAAFAALFSWRSTAAAGQGLSPQMRAQLCGEKKAGLAKLEAEAPDLHARVAKLQSEYDAASKAETDVLTGATEGVRTGMGGDLGVGLDVGRFALVAGLTKVREAKQKELASAREREAYVGSQIFLLRDIIEGLGCDAPTPAAPQQPPIDYNAINQLNQQFQQSGYGGAGPTSSQSAQPQSSSYTAPSAGFGAPGAAAASPPTSGGYYGYSPPYGTPSVQTPWDSLVPPTTWGGGPQPKNPCGGG